ncbi:BCCT family transporter [Halorhodospira sp. M38]|nr:MULTISPECIES: BCCT family transporter [Halorhodospira]MCG5528704.1 BCCT family transporter [Halorhodospira halophila]MCG5540383.1 BCCT family transporter [Halorhodospira sp. M39old]MCG5544031.1 BCCT family transporter [Halorhodospira sp. 9628]MCG5545764.1 BCCT family transporter [Halorhodospira sp. M38]
MSLTERRAPARPRSRSAEPGFGPDTRAQTTHVLGLELHAPVFIVSAGLLLLFLGLTLAFAEPARDLLEATLDGVRGRFAGVFLGTGNLLVLLCFALILLPAGNIRLGGAAARPEFGRLSWLTMLFAAGMGVGLMFWAVAEPVAYYTDWLGTPRGVEPGTEAAARLALGATLYHWGLHPWAIYAVMALALAFFAYNRGLPLTVRSAFYPLLGERTWGPIGHTIDIVAVVATVFGLATSLGFGAQQAASGLSTIFAGVEDALGTRLLLIAVVVGVAVASVLLGIQRGIRVLSNLNLGMAGFLLLFILVSGGLLASAVSLATAGVSYLGQLVPMSTPVGRDDAGFMETWTVFYLAWWISWSPFVGMFIARISYGRTVRELVTAVLLVPTAVTWLWISALGGEGLRQVQGGLGGLADGLGERESMALFHLLEQLPGTEFTAALAVLLVVIFFVTSSDSGSRVLDAVTAGGRLDTPRMQRVLWVVLTGVLAATLLFVGGEAALGALQAGAVASGLPFAIVVLALSLSLLIGLRQERERLSARGMELQPPRGEPTRGRTGLSRPQAAGCAYLLGPLSALLLLMLERADPLVRFHAVQSLVFSAAVLLLAVAILLLAVPLGGLPLLAWIGGGLLLLRACLVALGKEPWP